MATSNELPVLADGSVAAGANPTAMRGDDEAVEVLNDLLENARNGEYGFRACAKELPAGSSQRQALNQRASQYHEVCDELAQLIRRHGGLPAEGGTAGAAIHRGWVHVKSAIGANSELSILEECERGEEAAVVRCLEAMERNLPSDVRDWVARQAAAAQESRDRIRKLCDQARNGGRSKT
jgi:uncharacterized protein (TIGR02284 family)